MSHGNTDKYYRGERGSILPRSKVDGIRKKKAPAAAPGAVDDRSTDKYYAEGGQRLLAPASMRKSRPAAVPAPLAARGKPFAPDAIEIVEGAAIQAMTNYAVDVIKHGKRARVIVAPNLLQRVNTVFDAMVGRLLISEDQRRDIVVTAAEGGRSPEPKSEEPKPSIDTPVPALPILGHPGSEPEPVEEEDDGNEFDEIVETRKRSISDREGDRS